MQPTTGGEIPGYPAWGRRTVRKLVLLALLLTACSQAAIETTVAPLNVAPKESSPTFTDITLHTIPSSPPTKTLTPKPTSPPAVPTKPPAAPTKTPKVQPTKPPVSNAVCNCTGPDLDCKDFKRKKEAQACYNYCKSLGYGDIFKLDRDKDGKVCESLP